MATATAPSTPDFRRRRMLQWVALHSFAVGVALLFVLPFVFVVLTALMSDQQSLTRDLWPNPFAWHNLVDVWHTPGFTTWWRNTLVYAVLGTALTLLSSLPVAYALAYFPFRGRNVAMMIVIATMMLPPQVSIIPLYLVWAQNFHLTGTLWPLIIPLAFGDAFSIFLLRQFMLTVPRSYLEAAKMDGCGDFRTMVSVVIPMIKPAIAAVGLFQFFYCWNDYYGPLLYTSENEKAWTLSLGLASFRSLHHVDWNLATAATMLTLIPVVVLFFFAQKAFVQGVTLTGVKG
jgi:multiple sugar transport system permease protein